MEAAVLGPERRRPAGCWSGGALGPRPHDASVAARTSVRATTGGRDQSGVRSSRGPPLRGARSVERAEALRRPGGPSKTAGRTIASSCACRAPLSTVANLGRCSKRARQLEPESTTCSGGFGGHQNDVGCADSRSAGRVGGMKPCSSWRRSPSARCARRSRSPRRQGTPAAPIRDVVGNLFAVAVRGDGSVVSWGRAPAKRSRCQHPSNSQDRRSEWRLARAALTHCSKTAPSSPGVTTTSVWGMNGYGELGLGATGSVQSPARQGPWIDECRRRAPRRLQLVCNPVRRHAVEYGDSPWANAESCRVTSPLRRDSTCPQG